MEDLNRGGWCFLGMVVEVDAPACPRCGHSKTLRESLWGLESDADDAYFEDTVDDLICGLKMQLAKFASVVE